MGAFVGDLLQLVDNQVYLEQQVLNVYYYRVTQPLAGGSEYLEDLNTYWEDNVLNAIVDIQGENLLHVTREWRNMSNGVDLFTAATVVPGSNAVSGTASLPSFISAGFILRRTSLATRNGYKRFAGLQENQVTGNTYVGDVEITDAIAFALAADLNIGLISAAEPVIVKRPIEAPVEEYVYSSIDVAQFRGVGTQNSRKAGRGV